MRNNELLRVIYRDPGHHSPRGGSAGSPLKQAEELVQQYVGRSFGSLSVFLCVTEIGGQRDHLGLGVCVFVCVRERERIYVCTCFEICVICRRLHVFGSLWVLSVSVHMDKCLSLLVFSRMSVWVCVCIFVFTYE